MGVEAEVEAGGGGRVGEVGDVEEVEWREEAGEVLGLLRRGLLQAVDVVWVGGGDAREGTRVLVRGDGVVGISTTSAQR